MHYMLIRHKVKDFAKWKAEFDEHASARKHYGSQGGILFRSAEDPSEVVVLFEVKDLDRAREFAQSEDLRKTMERAGVADKPDVYYLDRVEQFST